ncbi:MAG: glycosyltransferase family 2 protein [Ignavibacteriales bacterium]|nr:MAG: glycosyltransferase family 2 protein [Ignavibacteriales bacterium]
MRISSIIIAKDEELNIGRCLSSLSECIDETIVIIDEDSSDKTEEIVKSFQTVKYYKLKWQGFSKTKQHAVSLTTNDWILWIDADEALTRELEKEIDNFKSTKPKLNAYSMKRRSYFLGRWIKHSGWYPGRVTRLFNKNFVSFSENDVHEHLVVNGETGQLKNDLEHFTDPTISHYFQKYNKYTSLAAEEMFKRNKNFSILDVTLRPFSLFFKMFIFKAGFLDGLQGFILAVFSSAYVFTKYSKLWELNRKDK